ncbi:MAG: CDP-diacylglycerol--glycerol-3-phosphate 3-phosphatidyltransferase [Alphaproteobacteria bacterium]|jgi:cardiolipin synthase|nr:CDP-diacylglycerol--glycerol-3-phosphate 3-phosphatidyltransferase [Thalassospira sp.]MCE2964290.1 CDP-diacylglycerol--glycerol-3-phosphate 3-phosphatidyltransferase [Alphaproteobacteria bacterium]
MMRLNVPFTVTAADWLTLARFITPLPLALLWWLPGGAWVCFVLFSAAALTDYFDGMVARRLGVSSGFGVMLDPIADKILVISTLLLLALSRDLSWLGLLAFWGILWRELIVAGLREYLSLRGTALPVVRLAKYKTALQMLACAVLLWENANGGYWPYWFGEGLLVLAALLTLWTGWGYVKTTLEALEKSDAAG